MPSKLSKAVPPFSRVVPQFGHRQGKGAPRAPFSTRLAPVPFYTPPANSCKGVPTRPVPPATGKGKLRFPRGGAALRRNASRTSFPPQKGSFRFHRGRRALVPKRLPHPYKREASAFLGGGAALRRDASRASFPLLKGEASLPQGWRALAPKRPRRSRQNKGSFRFHRGGAALRRNAPAVPGKKGKLRVHWDGGPLRRNAPAFPAK